MHIQPWKLLLFVNHFLSINWNHSTIEASLEWTRKTSVDWRSFCSEVTENWYQNQQAIGGNGVVVEIDESLIAKHKYGRGRPLSQIWVFGGIERVSKRAFVINVGAKRDAATLLPLIQRYILPGSIIYSDGWSAYQRISQLPENYSHGIINHSENFVDPVNPRIHTQNIERLWRDMKSYVKRPGISAKYMEQYIGRFLFIRSHRSGAAVHHFFLEVAKLYPFMGGRQRPEPMPDYSNDEDLPTVRPTFEEPRG